MDLTTRVSLVQNLLTTKEIPASVGAKLLDINRTSIYYKGTPVSDEELACKEIIDHLHTDNPAWGARQMSAQLKSRGYHVGRRKARRYMNEMDIYPIYPKMNLSKRMQQAKVCPYLLRNATILCLSFFCLPLHFLHAFLHKPLQLRSFPTVLCGFYTGCKTRTPYIREICIRYLRM